MAAKKVTKNGTKGTRETNQTMKNAKKTSGTGNDDTRIAAKRCGNVKIIKGSGGLKNWSSLTNVYHGSHVIIRDVDLDKSTHGKVVNGEREYKEFGKGFYTTPDVAQAEIYAKKARDDYNRSNHAKQDFGCVNVYEFKICDTGRSLKILVFDGVSKKWIDFVHKNRNLNYDHKYDVVIGPVADKRAGNILFEYFDLVSNGNYVDVNKTLKELRKLHLKSQILFHTEESKQYLKYVNSMIKTWSD